MVTAVLDGNLYLTLGTTEDDGSPRVSPVFYSHDDYVELYWVSSPHAAHSRNLAARPAVTGVVFDSTATPGGATAVYLTGTAAQVPDDELPQACARAFRALKSTAKAFVPGELTGDAPLRLYRLRADLIEIHVRGSDPDHGTGTDTRLRVDLSGAVSSAVQPSPAARDDSEAQYRAEFDAEVAFANGGSLSVEGSGSTSRVATSRRTRSRTCSSHRSGC